MEAPQFRSQRGDAASSKQPAWEQVPQSIARIGCCASPQPNPFLRYRQFFSVGLCAAADSDGRASASRSELPPAAAIALQQFERARGALAAGGIEFQPLGARFFPGIEERLHRPPGSFDAVGALKQKV